MRRFPLLAALLISTASQAAVLKDETLQRLLDQGRIAELEREARARGGADGQAALVLAQLRGNGALDEAVRAGEACVAQFPQAAACHYALASALGVQAQQGGMLKGLRLVGRVREGLGKALELEPAMFEARSSLQFLYLVVPGIAGGSVSKARELEQAVRSSQPEVAKLLRARMAAQDKRWEEAERELAGIQLGSQPSFHNEVVNAWAGLARHWNKQGEHAKSRARFEQLSQQLPALAAPLYQLARTLGDEGRPADAIRSYEKARGLIGADELPIDHRVGVAWMDLGDKAKARQYLQRFLQDPRANPSNADDARRRLKELG